MEPRALVVGGGIAGLQAALGLADLGCVVDLVEKGSNLGGRLLDLGKVFPTMDSASDVLSHIVSRTLDHAKIRTHLRTEVTDLSGKAGDFLVEITTNADGVSSDKAELHVSGIVLATGLEPIDAAIIPEFGYGRHKDVVTSLELERMMAIAERDGKALARPGDGTPVKTVAFIQCVGSRVEKRGVPYCSAVCCMGAIKNATLIKERYPDVDVYILYIDVRAQGKGHEELYKMARRVGVRFIRGQPSMVLKKARSERLLVCGENTLLRELYELPSDIVVLSVGLRQPEGNYHLLEMLGVQRMADGLATEKDPCIAPVESSVKGVFLVGTVNAPMDIRDSIVQGNAAAAKMMAFIRNRGET